MIGKCSFDQLEKFLKKNYEDEFSWDFEGSIVNGLAGANAALPIATVDELMIYLKLLMDEIYLSIDDGDESVIELSSSSEISDYVVYDYEHSDFLNISISPWIEDSNTILAISKYKENII